jgi:mannose-6-phosphate isomerase-like protein (cupin superfamily)
MFGGGWRIRHGVRHAKYYLSRQEVPLRISQGGSYMTEIKVIRLDEVESQPLPGTQGSKAGLMKRIIYPPRVQSKGTFFAYAECSPGFSPHRWHTHLGDTGPGYKVEYPDTFEEVYYIIQGRGKIQWKTPDGEVQEKSVNEGDTIFMPVGVPEHQLLNDGEEKIVMVACGCPTPKVTLKEGR